jgi:flagellar M-ring protein FliF
MFDKLRQQVAQFWGHQSKTQRIIIISLAVAVTALVPIFLIWASTPTYTLAFSNLDEASAGQIVEKLKEANIPYQLRNSGTILVPANQVYEVRLSMARDGLPQGNTVGYELFSGNTLGMTEFTQRVNYQRALEGELERTIGSMSPVQAVRVHIVTPEKTLLESAQAPTTSSVTVQEKPGQHLDAAQVQAITHLMASSVEGLKPDNVVVVDINGNMLASGSAKGDEAIGTESDNRRAAEVSAAREIQNKISDLLISALGPNRSVVQVSVSMDWTQRETTSQAYQPNPDAIRSSQIVHEAYTSTNGVAGGVPGASSNLPPATATVVPGSGGLVYTRTEQTTNYELTKTDTREIDAPGKIDRLSLSVLVDGVTDPQQLTTLKSVIGAAAGINETRGDLLAVETLAFDRTYYKGQADDLTKEQRNNTYVRIGEWAAVIVAVVGLLWYVQRLLSNLKLASAEAWTPVLKPVGEVGLPGGMPAMSQMASSITQPAPKIEQVVASLPAFELPAPSPEDEQTQAFLQRISETDPASVAELIQLWLGEDEKQNG